MTSQVPKSYEFHPWAESTHKYIVWDPKVHPLDDISPILLNKLCRSFSLDQNISIFGFFSSDFEIYCTGRVGKKTDKASELQFNWGLISEALVLETKLNQL